MEVKVVGSPCGCHGPYVFYKGLRISSSVTSSTTASVNNTTTTATNTTTTATPQNTQNNNLVRQFSNNKNNNNSDSKLTKQSCLSDSLDCNGGDTVEPCTDDQGMDYSFKKPKKPTIVALGDCIQVRPWSDSPIACLAELRMVWKDKNEQCLLTGLRLYFLPENTPLGRNGHGEDEVVAISDKVIIRAEDLLSWIDDDLEWNWGLKAVYTGQSLIPMANPTNRYLLRNTFLDFCDVDTEKNTEMNCRTTVTVLSYPRYCRYRATLRRLERIEDVEVRNTLIESLSGFVAASPNTKVMFCRDTFDYPELETHDLLCNHLAPRLKGRPRGKRKKTMSGSPSRRDDSLGSDSNESEESECSVKARVKLGRALGGRPQLRHNHRPTRSKTKSESTEHKPIRLTVRTTSTRSMHVVKSDEDEENEDPDDEEDDDEVEEDEKDGVHDLSSKKRVARIKKEPANTKLCSLSRDKVEEGVFLIKLHKFMVSRNTPILKSVWLELKNLNLHAIYKRVQDLGGFDKVTECKMWRSLFDDSATPWFNTITKKNYERVLLPFESSERLLDTSVVKTESIANDVAIKEESQSNGEEKSEPALTIEQMREIQKKVKSKELTANTSPQHVSLPVTVIVGSQQSSPSPPHRSNAADSGNTSSQIKIQQPHTTITVHQTTIHPQMSPKIANQIQITNQIQIQQITVQPNRDGGAEDSVVNYNIKQDRNGQEVQIEQNGEFSKILKRQHSGDEINITTSSSGVGAGGKKTTSSLRSVRVTGRSSSSLVDPQTSPQTLKENIPIMLSQRMTTITPILSGANNNNNSKDKENNNVVVSSRKRSQSPAEVIDLVDSDGETSKTSPVKMYPPVKKRKLEILREGGLEVTPIHYGSPIPNISLNPVSSMNYTKHLMSTMGSKNINSVESTKSTSQPPSTLPPAPSVSNRIPPIVMPDKSKIPMASTFSTAIPNPLPPPKFQSTCMFTKTSNIFGDPKDVFLAPAHLPSTTNYPASKKPVSNPLNLLDLTATTATPIRKNQIEIMKVPSFKQSSPIKYPMPVANTSPPPAQTPPKPIRTKTKIEAPNVQITRIPHPGTTLAQNVHNSQNHNIRMRAAEYEKSMTTKTTTIPNIPNYCPSQSNQSSSQPSQHGLQRRTSPPSVHSPSPRTPPTSGRKSSSNSSSSSSHHVPPVPTPPSPSVAPQSFLPNIPGLQAAAAGGGHINPLLPLLDPYLSLLYANQGMIFPTHIPPEILQYYAKNLPQSIVPSSKS